MQGKPALAGPLLHHTGTVEEKQDGYGGSSTHFLNAGLTLKSFGSRRKVPCLVLPLPRLIVSMGASGQMCGDLWPNPRSPGHRAGQRPEGKGQATGAETKLDQLIHANLFRSCWVAGQTDMGLCESP